LKLTLFTLAVLTVFIAGILSKSKIESILQGANIGGTTKETIGNDKVGGDKGIGGDKVGGDKVGGNQIKQNGSIGDINTGSGSNIQITINPGDDRYKNSSQPNLLDGNSIEGKNVDLGIFRGANLLTKEQVLPDYVNFTSFYEEKIAILDKTYKSGFNLTGGQKERKIVFSLSGNQKGIFVQFGLKDLPSQGDNSIYDVSILTSNDTETKRVWSGKIIYGTKNQIVSLPFDGTNAKSLIIKYSISQGSSNHKLFFTRAELLY
jgi:hypothetical protein